MKKAFTLTETIVALALILIISVAFYSTASFSNASFSKSLIIKYGINEIENVLTIFQGSEIENDLQTFENNMKWSYSSIETEKTENTTTFLLKRDANNNDVENNNLGKFVFKVTIENDMAKLNAEISYKNNQLYFMPNDFVKAVQT